MFRREIIVSLHVRKHMKGSSHSPWVYTVDYGQGQGSVYSYLVPKPVLSPSQHTSSPKCCYILAFSLRRLWVSLFPFMWSKQLYSIFCTISNPIAKDRDVKKISIKDFLREAGLGCLFFTELSQPIYLLCMCVFVSIFRLTYIHTTSTKLPLKKSTKILLIDSIQKHMAYCL